MFWCCFGSWKNSGCSYEYIEAIEEYEGKGEGKKRELAKEKAISHHFPFQETTI